MEGMQGGSKVRHLVRRMWHLLDKAVFQSIKLLQKKKSRLKDVVVRKDRNQVYKCKQATCKF